MPLIDEVLSPVAWQSRHSNIFASPPHILLQNFTNRITQTASAGEIHRSAKVFSELDMYFLFSDNYYLNNFLKMVKLRPKLICTHLPRAAPGVSNHIPEHLATPPSYHFRQYGVTCLG